jgi:hypothetical protein
MSMNGNSPQIVEPSTYQSRHISLSKLPGTISSLESLSSANRLLTSTQKKRMIGEHIFNAYLVLKLSHTNKNGDDYGWDLNLVLSLLPDVEDIEKEFNKCNILKLYHIIHDTVHLLPTTSVVSDQYSFSDQDEFTKRFLNNIDGKVINVNTKLLQLLVKKIPFFNAKVADFNENLYYDIQHKNGLSHLLLDEDSNSSTINEKLVQTFEVSIQNALASSRKAKDKKKCTDNSIQYRGSFMKTDKTIPQPPHVDFDWDILDQHGHKLWIAFFPLTQAGMFIQLWDHGDKYDTDCEHEGILVFIPYGKLLIVPSYTVHGGGFKSSVNGNLRFHLYISTDGCELPKHVTNKYTEKHDKGKELCDRFVNARNINTLSGLIFDE